MKKDFKPISARIVPRFAGISTFLRLPHHENPKDVDAMIIGVPFDGGTSFRPGARFGPHAVRAASALTRGFHPQQGVDLFTNLKVCDGGDVLCVPMNLTRTLENIEKKVFSIAKAGAIPVMIGGDHTISLANLRALTKIHGPLGLIHFDAHSDTYGPAWDENIHHGTIFRNAFEEGLLQKKSVFQLGIRGPLTSANDHDFARKNGFRIITATDIKRNLTAAIKFLKGLNKRQKYFLSFDMDCLDPAYAPGTGTPVPGGLSSFEALELVRNLVSTKIVGFDIVEISPDHDPTGNTALVAATLLTEILASLAA